MTTQKNKRPKAASNAPHTVEPRDRQTDTAIIGNNSLHLMHNLEVAVSVLCSSNIMSTPCMLQSPWQYGQNCETGLLGLGEIASSFSIDRWLRQRCKFSKDVFLQSSLSRWPQTIDSWNCVRWSWSISALYVRAVVIYKVKSENQLISVGQLS